MGWVKLDDGFFRHRKAIQAGKDGRVLFLAGLCYCGAGLTDGFIPDGALVVLAAETGIGKVRNAADALVAAGLWHQVEGGYEVHGYLDHNTASGKVKQQRDAARDRMKRIRSQDVRANISERSQDVRQPETDTETEQEPERKKDTPKPPPVDWTAFESFWTRYPRKTAKDDAKRAWQKVGADPALVAEILTGLDRLIPSYRAAEPRFVPHPSTFLNGRRWTDEPIPAAQPRAPALLTAKPTHMDRLAEYDDYIRSSTQESPR